MDYVLLTICHLISTGQQVDFCFDPLLIQAYCARMWHKIK